jgi:PiT family inorganic phosphate transporter
MGKLSRKCRTRRLGFRRNEQGRALIIALGFEFVNGFHDTANAVATVIYTHSLPPLFAVVWSGAFNFLGVMISTGAVAYGIITLLPVELILQVGSDGRLRDDLLAAAGGDHLEPRHLGAGHPQLLLPRPDRLDHGRRPRQPADGPGRPGDLGRRLVAGDQVFEALLFSPLVGFAASALLLLAMKF